MKTKREGGQPNRGAGLMKIAKRAVRACEVAETHPASGLAPSLQSRRRQR